MSTDTKKEVAIDEEIITLASKIEPHLVVDEEGTLTEDGDAAAYSSFLAHRGSDLDEQIKAQLNESLFATAFLLAAGNKAIEAKKNNKDIKRVAGIVSMGRHEMGFNYNTPTGRKPDGTWKEPSVSVITRRFEHDSHKQVRASIYEQTKAIMD